MGEISSLGDELLVGAVKTGKHLRGHVISMGVDFNLPWIFVKWGTACLPFLQAEDHGVPLIPVIDEELAF